ncbi:MAG: hypothetical protein WD960_13510 [Gemmatimonadota bacterium]
MSSFFLLLLGLLPALSTAPALAAPVATDLAPVASISTTPALQTPGEDPVRVFLDCQTMGCDFDFFRTELTWVDWVRDRQDADVHVMVTSQATGGGGRLFDMSFEGRRDFVDEATFTLTHTSSADDSIDDRRQGILRTLSFGLVRFASESSVADRLEVRFTAAPDAAVEGAEAPAAGAQPEDDPWNLWVFSTSLRASANGESSSGNQNYNGSLSATRTSEDWRIRVSVSGSYGESRFDLPDRTVRSITRSYNGSGLLVHSVSARTSGGIRGSARSSTFQNQDLSLQIGPAFEVSAFPYEESTRRALTFEYWAGLNHFDYTEETIFEKEAETLAQHRATVSLGLRQPWGTASAGLSGSQYLHDLSLTQLSLNTGLNLRLLRGLSLTVNGSYSRIRDQLNLPRGNATDDEILTRQQQLATDYRYFVTFGITYQFGSIFSNIVNPRMGGSSGGTIIMF